jgi:WD40 repeat protein
MYRAIKIVYRHTFKDSRPFDRELAGIKRFEPISRLHEGFIDVLHVGLNEAAGYFYYVMELGDDEATGQEIEPATYTPKTLSGEIGKLGRLSFEECLRLGLALSQALADLHQQGLVHRDIKPSNIIFVNGHPKLADIGLVADVGEALSFVGTVGFMPPEGPGSPQADVYSLGKVLYEAATGKDRQDFPALPTMVGEPDGESRFLELNEVLLKACEQDRPRRYQSGAEMHADIVVLSNGRSVRRLRYLEARLRRFKKTAVVAGLAAVVVLVLGYLGYSEWRKRFEATQRRVGASVAYGMRALENGDNLGALRYYAEALDTDQKGEASEASHRLRFGSVLGQCPKLTFFCYNETEEVQCHLQFAPDERRLLVSGDGHRPFFVDTVTGEKEFLNISEEELRRVTMSRDGRYLAEIRNKQQVVVSDLREHRVVCSLSNGTNIEQGCFSPDGSLFASGGASGYVRVWSIPAGRLIWDARAHSLSVLCLAFSPDGRLLATGSRDGTARIWDIKTGQPVVPVLKHNDWVASLAFSPDGAQMVSTGNVRDPRLRVWKVADGQRVRPDMLHEDLVQGAVFTQDGRFIVSASNDGTVRLWDAREHLPAKRNPILRHGERVLGLAVSEDGRRIATACSDGACRVWDLAGACLSPEVIPGRYASADCRRVFSVASNQMEVCDRVTGTAVCPPLKFPGRFERCLIAPKGDYVMVCSVIPNPAGGTNDLLQIWDAKLGRPEGEPVEVPFSIRGFAMSPNGQRLAVFRKEMLWVVEPARSGQVLFSNALPGNVTGGTFSPDSRRFLAWLGSKGMLYDLETGRSVGHPLTNAITIVTSRFSEDGSRILTACSDRTFSKGHARLWSAATGEPLGPCLWHGDGVLMAVFSSDERKVATASEDFTAAIWDPVRGTQLVPALKHKNQVLAVCFSPDDRWVATTCSDGFVRIWNAETGDPVTPPLESTGSANWVHFTSDGGVIGGSATEDIWRWQLSQEARPVGDVVALSRLLSDSSSARFAFLNRGPSVSLEPEWRELKAKFPGDFSVQPGAVDDWEFRQVKESEAEENWPSAAFHLRRLLERHPGDSHYENRLKTITKRLAPGSANEP